MDSAVTMLSSRPVRERTSSEQAEGEPRGLISFVSNPDGRLRVVRADEVALDSIERFHGTVLSTDKSSGERESPK